MKNNVLFLAVIFTLMSIVASAQWKTSNSNVYYDQGNVGIGMIPGNNKLEIRHNGEVMSITPGGIGFNRSVADGGIYTAEIPAWQITAKKHVFTLEGYNGAAHCLLNILPNGNVGIGTYYPQARLDVDGTIYASQTISTPVKRWDLGSGEINFTDNGFGYPYSAKFLTFVTPNYSEVYGMTSDYGVGTGGQLSLVAKHYIGNIGFYTGEAAVERMRISNTGNVGIGTNAPDHKLDVVGSIRAHEVLVNTTKTADFVFDENYELLSLSALEEYVTDNKHLPDIDSADEMIRNGVNIGDMQIKLLQKVEELTLYIIELKKEIGVQQKEIDLLKQSTLR